MSSSGAVSRPPVVVEAVRGYFLSPLLQCYFYPRRNVVSVYKRAPDGEIIAFMSCFWDGCVWKAQDNLNKTVKKILGRYNVYLLCYKGGELKERNALIPSDDDINARGVYSYCPSTFTMIIREKGIFYVCVSDRFVERNRYRTDNPFPTGEGATETIMDHNEYVHIKRVDPVNPFDVWPISDFKPCEDVKCFCKSRGLANDLCGGHICPICKHGVEHIKKHLQSYHKLDFYPTYAEIPKPPPLPSPGVQEIKRLLVDIDRLGPCIRTLQKWKRARERDEGIAGNEDHPPSVKKTNQGGDSEPLEQGGGVVG